MSLLLASTPFYPQNFNVELIATWSDGNDTMGGTDVAITPDGWVYVLTGDFGNGTGHTFYILDGRNLPDSGLKFVDSVRSIYSLSAMTLWKDYLYVHDYGGGGILVYDISDRANPRFVRRVVPPGKEGEAGWRKTAAPRARVCHPASGNSRLRRQPRVPGKGVGAAGQAHSAVAVGFTFAPAPPSPPGRRR